MQSKPGRFRIRMALSNMRIANSTGDGQPCGGSKKYRQGEGEVGRSSARLRTRSRFYQYTKITRLADSQAKERSVFVDFSSYCLHAPKKMKGLSINDDQSQGAQAIILDARKAIATTPAPIPQVIKQSSCTHILAQP
jgi:hypothetical protein